MYVFYLFVHCLYYTTQSMQRTCSDNMKLILVRKKVTGVQVHCLKNFMHIQ